MGRPCHLPHVLMRHFSLHRCRVAWVALRFICASATWFLAVSCWPAGCRFQGTRWSASFLPSALLLALDVDFIQKKHFHWRSNSCCWIGFHYLMSLWLAIPLLSRSRFIVNCSHAVALHSKFWWVFYCQAFLHIHIIPFSQSPNFPFILFFPSAFGLPMKCPHKEQMAFS